MIALKLLRWEGDDGRPRLGVTADMDLGVVDLTKRFSGEVRSIQELDQRWSGEGGNLAEAAQRWWAQGPTITIDPAHLIIPIELEEVWAAGVTYERSREARRLETRAQDQLYDWVYEAARPELFFKAPKGRTVGPGDFVGLRRDATWHVPEPELTVILDSQGQVFGYTVGNDMTARDMEAKNPLYLPQAKLFHNSAAIGPAVVLAGTVDPYHMDIQLTITRYGATVFFGQTQVSRLKRSIPELIGYMVHEWPLKPWTGLMTGTGIVPPDHFALEDGDVIAITISDIGTLTNRARRIDEDWVNVAKPPARLLRVDPRDTVLVALGALEPGAKFTVDGGVELTIRDSIPFGHKVALTAIEVGDPIIKYGEVIGIATRAIAPGEHAHVHNIDSNRGRGDLIHRKEDHA